MDKILMHALQLTAGSNRNDDRHGAQDTRPVSQFNQIMEGFAHIATGLKYLDDASEGELGRFVQSLFR